MNSEALEVRAPRKQLNFTNITHFLLELRPATRAKSKNGKAGQAIRSSYGRCLTPKYGNES